MAKRSHQGYPPSLRQYRRPLLVLVLLVVSVVSVLVVWVVLMLMVLLLVLVQVVLLVLVLAVILSEAKNPSSPLLLRVPDPSVSRVGLLPFSPLP